MVEQFGNEEQCYCGDVNANGIPVEDEEYSVLHPLYKPVFDIVTSKLSEPAVKYAAKEHGISYNLLMKIIVKNISSNGSLENTPNYKEK